MLPPFGIRIGIGGPTVSSSPAEDVAETVTGPGHTLINSRGTTGGGGSAGMTINPGLENGKPSRAVKRDSEGFPKRSKAQADADAEEEEGEAGWHSGERGDENNKDDEDDEEKGSGRTEERILSVVEETSFDLDKVSLQLHFFWARGSKRARQPVFVEKNADDSELGRKSGIRAWLLPHISPNCLPRRPPPPHRPHHLSVPRYRFQPLQTWSTGCNALELGFSRSALVQGWSGSDWLRVR